MYENTSLPVIVTTALLAETGHTLGLSAIQMLMLYAGLAVIMVSASLIIRNRK